MALNAEQLKSLCDFDNKTNEYISKSGQDYVDALKNLLHPGAVGNKNDIPFLKEDIVKQPTLQQFHFKALDQFVFNCKLKANPMRLDCSGNFINLGNGKISKEEVIAFDYGSDDAKSIFENAVGVVYLITCNVDAKEHIIKIGQTGGTFKKRLGSYNCGYVASREKGTASTTNFKIVQSFVATRLEFKLYIKDCSSLTKPYKWAGRKTTPIASPLVEAVENICLQKFEEKFGKKGIKKPLANVQTKKQTED